MNEDEAIFRASNRYFSLEAVMFNVSISVSLDFPLLSFSVEFLSIKIAIKTPNAAVIDAKIYWLAPIDIHKQTENNINDYV